MGVGIGLLGTVRIRGVPHPHLLVEPRRVFFDWHAADDLRDVSRENY